MKISINQPYFFPYIGYFQLINYSDIFVNLDHVNFIKSNYMTRNVIKDNNVINVNIFDASSNKKCLETLVVFKKNYIRKLKNKLYHLYLKTPNYNLVIEEIINPIFIEREITISKLNFTIIKTICNYLEIKTKLIETSENITSNKRENCVVDIVKKFNGTEYINSIGGQKLYSYEFFKKNEIDLKFIKPKNLTFSDPYNSILDIIFKYDKQLIIDNLNNFELIYG